MLSMWSESMSGSCMLGLVIEKQIGNIVYGYSPQVGLSIEEKDAFWHSFIIALSGIPKQDSILICTA